MSNEIIEAAGVRPGMTIGVLARGLCTDVEQAFTGEVRIRLAVTFGGPHIFELVATPDHPILHIRPNPKGDAAQPEDPDAC